MVDEQLIEPRRMKGEPELSGPCLFFVNPSEAGMVKGLAREHGGQTYYLFHSNLFALEEEARPRYWAGPAMGASMAVMTLEKLIALGGREFVVFGWCGALHPQVGIGDLILPTWALSEEGTSQHYPLATKPGADGDLLDQLTVYLQASGVPVQQGPIWTTDAPYRESRDKVSQYASQGLLGVDMEYAALCTVAAFRGVRLIAALLVSDELWHQEWKPGFQGKEFKKKRRVVFQLIDSFLCKRKALPPLPLS